MATHYSNHFHAGGTTVTTRAAGHIPAGGLNGERCLVSTAYTKALSLTTDTGRVLRGIPSNARIHLFWVSADDASAAGAFNVGVHQTEENGGAVVAADLFCTALAKNANAESFFEAGAALRLADRGKLLWEILGLTVDPQRSYDITYTPSTSFTTTALGISMTLIYSLG